MSITSKNFEEILKNLHDFASEKKLAVAVSGGGDSMALAHLLSRFCMRHGVILHALTVDHGLRKESVLEARQVSQWLSGTHHKVLKWTGEKPKTRIQEEARNARYQLMSNYCQKNKINYLFLAHHADDQVETFLFRLAKGSGLDGLTVMPAMQKQKDIILVRPLLAFSHRDLIAVCNKNKLNWLEDPSNEANKYARVRLRQSQEILEREGLTTLRIVTLASRLNRARNALEQLTETAFKSCLIKAGSERIEIDLKIFLMQPEEIGLRVLQKCLNKIGRARAYPPSLQILEEINTKIYNDSLKAQTLGGCVVRRSKRRGKIEITKEQMT